MKKSSKQIIEFTPVNKEDLTPLMTILKNNWTMFIVTVIFAAVLTVLMVIPKGESFNLNEAMDLLVSNITVFTMFIQFIIINELLKQSQYNFEKNNWWKVAFFVLTFIISCGFAIHSFFEASLERNDIHFSYGIVDAYCFCIPCLSNAFASILERNQKTTTFKKSMMDNKFCYFISTVCATTILIFSERFENASLTISNFEVSGIPYRVMYLFATIIVFLTPFIIINIANGIMAKKRTFVEWLVFAGRLFVIIVALYIRKDIPEFKSNFNFIDFSQSTVYVSLFVLIPSRSAIKGAKEQNSKELCEDIIKSLSEEFTVEDEKHNKRDAHSSKKQLSSDKKVTKKQIFKKKQKSKKKKRHK